MSLSDYALGDSIDYGQFGVVYVGTHIKTQEVVAIKVIDMFKILKSKLEQQLIQEIEILSLVKHPNILCLIDHFEMSDNTYLITEYYPNGNLYDKLRKLKILDENLVAKYIFQLNEAVDYLHKLNIIHRDIKPENILLTLNDDIVLCDFGWAIKLNDEKIIYTRCGTLDYFAPEIVDSKGYDYTIDLWMIGVLTYELLTGGPPFMSEIKGNTFENIRNVIVRYPNHLSDKSTDFIQKLLVLNPTNRMNTNEIKKHPYLTVQNIDQLSIK